MADFEDLIRAVEGNDPDMQVISRDQLRYATEEQIIRLCIALHRNTKVRTVDFSGIHQWPNRRVTPEHVLAIAEMLRVNTFIDKAKFRPLTNDEFEPIA